MGSCLKIEKLWRARRIVFLGGFSASRRRIIKESCKCWWDTPGHDFLSSYFTSSLGICGRRSSFLFFVLLWVSTLVKNNSKSLNAQRLKNRDVYRLIMILGTKVENETFWSGFQTLLLVCSLSSRTNPYRHLMPRFVCNLEWSLQSFKTIGKTSYQ